MRNTVIASKKWVTLSHLPLKEPGQAQPFSFCHCYSSPYTASPLWCRGFSLRLPICLLMGPSHPSPETRLPLSYLPTQASPSSLPLTAEKMCLLQHSGHHHDPILGVFAQLHHRSHWHFYNTNGKNNFALSQMAKAAGALPNFSIYPYLTKPLALGFAVSSPQEGRL